MFSTEDLGTGDRYRKSSPEVITELWLSVGIVRFPPDVDGDPAAIGEYRERILDLARQETCRVVEFDLSAVRHLPDGLLGVIASLIREHDVKVRVRTASAEVREALEVTTLRRIVSLVA